MNATEKKIEVVACGADVALVYVNGIKVGMVRRDNDGWRFDRPGLHGTAKTRAAAVKAITQ